MKKSFLLLSLLVPGFLFMNHTLKAQSNREWTVVASYQIPGKASGLAWDGTYLYSGLYSAPGDDNLIYKINPADGSYTLQCAGPFTSAYGLTFDGTYLWTTDHPNSSGEHQITWDGFCAEGNKCPAGIYLYRVTAGKAHSTGTIVRM